MPKLLVVGATGTLGRAVIEAADHWDRLGTARGPLPNSPFPLFRLDITDPAATLRFVRETAPDLIVNCAGQPDVDWCEQHAAAARLLHVDGTKSLVAAAAATGAKLIHISSDFVFDGRKGNYKEADPPNPINSYGRTKRDSELAVPAEHLVVRTTFYGWSVRKPSLAQIIVTTLRAEQTFNAFADAFFTPCYAPSLAERILKARNTTGLLHLAGPERLSKLTFARAVAKAFSLPAESINPYPLSAVPFKAPRPADTSLDKVVALLGIERIRGVSARRLRGTLAFPLRPGRRRRRRNYRRRRCCSARSRQRSRTR